MPAAKGSRASEFRSTLCHTKDGDAEHVPLLAGGAAKATPAPAEAPKGSQVTPFV